MTELLHFARVAANMFRSSAATPPPPLTSTSPQQQQHHPAMPLHPPGPVEAYNEAAAAYARAQCMTPAPKRTRKPRDPNKEKKKAHPKDTEQHSIVHLQNHNTFNANTHTTGSFKMMTMDITKTEPNVGLTNPQNSQNPSNMPNANSGGGVGGPGSNNNNTNHHNNNNPNGLMSSAGGPNANANNNSITAALNNNNNNNNGSQLCAGCGKHIQDRYLLRALDMLWHEDCLKCGCCDCRLGEVGSTLYTKGNLMLCKRDYLRLFGNTGYCAACSKVIPAFEMVMRARTNVYHLECFACQQCNHRFCVGDRFYLCENKILCEYDYEERLVFASMANHPILKRHASSIGQSSPTHQAGGGGGLLGGSGPGGGPMQNGVGPRGAPGDHNNNNGPQTPTGNSPYGVQAAQAAAAAAAAAAHMKGALGASS